MKKQIILVSSLLLICTAGIQAFGPRTTFIGRSVSQNIVRDEVGWLSHINIPIEDSWNSALCIVPEYSRSTKSGQLADFLFGGKTFACEGSSVTNRASRSILADYFGLPRDYQSKIHVAPVITNFVMAFNWYFAFNTCWIENIFVRLQLPVVHAKWDLNICENVQNSGTAFFPAGYMSNARIDRSALPTTFNRAMEGTMTFGDMHLPLASGRIFGGRQNEVLCGDLQFMIGWNPFMSDWYHAGAALRVVAPTGNRPNGEFLFDVISGNGKFWEVGALVTSHIDLWSSCDEIHRVACYADANITHLFATHQYRSYDLKNNGNGSRYMLLENVGSPSQNLFIDGAGTTAVANQYQGFLLPAINATTLRSRIAISVQTDVLFNLSYFHACGLEVDFGYNFWLRSAEKLICRESLYHNACGRYTIKGDAQVYGFDSNNNAVPLSASQHNATIYGGQSNGNSSYTNENADNPALAFNNTEQLLQLNAADSASLMIAQTPINTSHPAILLQDSDINESSALMNRSHTHKIYGYIGGSWDIDDCASAYLGVGGAVELAHLSPCGNNGHGQFSIWFRLGLAI